MQVACHLAIWHVLCFPAIFVRNGYASRVPARTLARLLPWTQEGTAVALVHAQAMCTPATPSERNGRGVPLLAPPWGLPCTLVREATLVAWLAVACNGARSSWPRWGVVGGVVGVPPWPGACGCVRACPQPGVLVKSCVRCALCGRNTSCAATRRQPGSAHSPAAGASPVCVLRGWCCCATTRACCVRAGTCVPRLFVV